MLFPRTQLICRIFTSNYTNTLFLYSGAPSEDFGTFVIFTRCCVAAETSERVGRCFDRRRRRIHEEGDRWERVIGVKTLDCTCERNERNRMQISCTGESEEAMLLLCQVNKILEC